MRTRNRRQLVEWLREQRICTADGETASVMLDPNVLTLGFARRFATYKRPNLMLSWSSVARPIPGITRASG